MSKIIVSKNKLIQWSVILTVIAFVSFGLHLILINYMEIELSYPLWSVYVFNLVTSVILLSLIRAKIGKLDIRVSWVYLSGILAKLILFALVFMYPLFFISTPNMPDRLNLFFPFILFFVMETYFVTRITKGYFGD